MCETSGEGGIRQRTGFYSRRGIDRCGRHDAEGLEGADSLSRLESARTWLSCTERILRLGPSFRRHESVCALFFGARQNGEALEGGTSVGQALLFTSDRTASGPSRVGKVTAVVGAVGQRAKVAYGLQRNSSLVIPRVKPRP